jgi:hypothetical protein
MSSRALVAREISSCGCCVSRRKFVVGCVGSCVLASGGPQVLGNLAGASEPGTALASSGNLFASCPGTGPARLAKHWVRF